MPKEPIPFFMDNCVAESVGKMLDSTRHDVVRLREQMARDTKDPVVAIACADSGRVLITHDRDFKAIARRLDMTKKGCKRLHRVSLHCLEPNAVNRMKAAMSIIEFEWDRLRSSARDDQLVIEISNAAIRIVR